MALSAPDENKNSPRTLRPLKSIMSVVLEKDEANGGAGKGLVSMFKASIKQRALDKSASNTCTDSVEKRRGCVTKQEVPVTPQRKQGS